MRSSTRIIILSNDRSLRSLLKARLIEDGYRVDAPRDPGRAALRRSAALVLVDLGAVSPAESPLLGAALALPPECRLIILSDDGLPSSRVGTFASRRVEVVSRPFELDGLSSLVGELLMERRPTGGGRDR